MDTKPPIADRSNLPTFTTICGAGLFNPSPALAF
jgi:hypothetical protein